MLDYLLNVFMFIIVYWLIIEINYCGTSINKVFLLFWTLVHLYDPVVKLSKNLIEISKLIEYEPYQPVYYFHEWWTNIGGKNKGFHIFSFLFISYVCKLCL